MKYSLTFLEADYERLCAGLFPDRTSEQGAFLLCGVANSDAETRLLVREVIPLDSNDIHSSSERHMAIDYRAVRRALRHAHEEQLGFVFVHSHPVGIPHHSSQDDRTEAELFSVAYNRVRGTQVHGSIVMSDVYSPVGRVWLEDGSTVPLSVIRTIGTDFRFYRDPSDPAGSVPTFFDRQVRAFGSDIQRLLRTLTVGIVGLGGTGSAVAQQLARLGVGHLVLVDGQTFDATNVNRVYGSRLADESMPKVDLTKRAIEEIGVGAKVTTIQQAVTYESALLTLRDCDIVFGCTDDDWGRAILSRLATYYFIPFFDMGVKVFAPDQVIEAVRGRVTTVVPPQPCLYCLGRINAQAVTAQMLWETNPSEAAVQHAQGYIDGLADPAPAVIPFTTAIAASAVTEFLHRLTGFLGSERKASEVRHLIDRTRLRTTAKGSTKPCFCNDPEQLGRGDAPLSLGVRWRST